MGKKSDLPKLEDPLHGLLEEWVDALADNLGEQEADDKEPERDLDDRRVEICMGLIGDVMRDGVKATVEAGDLDVEDFGPDAEKGEWTDEEVIGSLKRIAVQAVIDR